MSSDGFQFLGFYMLSSTQPAFPFRFHAPRCCLCLLFTCADYITSPQTAMLHVRHAKLLCLKIWIPLSWMDSSFWEHFRSSFSSKTPEQQQKSCSNIHRDVIAIGAQGRKKKVLKETLYITPGVIIPWSSGSPFGVFLCLSQWSNASFLWEGGPAFNAKCPRFRPSLPISVASSCKA